MRRAAPYIYRSKMHPVLKRNFEVFPVVDWITAVTAHIPNTGDHLLRYYGWYSNVNRGKRKKAEEHAQHAAPAGAVEIPPPLGSSIFKQRWAELIKKVYEARCCVPGVGARCASLPLLTNARSSRTFSPTWGCGHIPRMPR